MLVLDSSAVSVSELANFVSVVVVSLFVLLVFVPIPLECLLGKTAGCS